MKDRLLLTVGIGLTAIAIVGMATTGSGTFDLMRSGYSQMGPAMMFDSTGVGAGRANPTIEGASAVAVTLDDFTISPAQVVIAEGEPTNLIVTNTGAVPHDFSVPDLGISVVVPPGETVTTGVPAQPIGTYDTVCTVPGHASIGMVGTLVVESRA